LPEKNSEAMRKIKLILQCGLNCMSGVGVLGIVLVLMVKIALGKAVTRFGLVNFSQLPASWTKNSTPEQSLKGQSHEKLAK
jgi:hypothetical protein